MTNSHAEASAPIVYGLALSTPAVVVNRLVDALIRYRRRIGTRWRVYTPLDQAILTCAWLEGGHTYRSLGEGNGVPRSSCHHLVTEGIKVLARRALPLAEVIRLATAAGWDHLIVDGVNLPTERVAARWGHVQYWYSGKHRRHGGAVQTVAAPDGELLWAQAALRCLGERANAQLKQWRILTSDFRGDPRQLTAVVKAIQTLHHWTRDPFGARTTVTGS